MKLKKTFATILALTILSLSAFAQADDDTEWPQFTGDSVLIVMVDFPDMQFQHTSAELLSIISEYGCTGKRVVGPYHSPGSPAAYQNRDVFFSHFCADFVYNSAAADVDMTHFPDSNYKFICIVFPGSAATMYQQNSLLGNLQTYWRHRLPGKECIYHFASESSFFDDNGDTSTFSIGDSIVYSGGGILLGIS